MDRGRRLFSLPGPSGTIPTHQSLQMGSNGLTRTEFVAKHHYIDPTIPLTKYRAMNEEHLFFSNLFKLIEQYMISDRADAEHPVVRYLEPGKLKEKLDLSIPEEGTSFDTLLEDIRNYLTFSVDTAHKQFLNQLFGGTNVPAFAGEIITALTNTSMYTYEVAPVATLMEMELIGKLCSLVGYEDGDGTFLTGGSNANLVAMFSARNKICPDIKTQGMHSSSRLSAFVSEQSHYSFDIAANLLGIGTDRVYKIPVDAGGSMRVDLLDSAVQKSLEKGETPFFIAATAGTTLLGAFDPIRKIVTIGKHYGIWVHVDGAFGGSIILSSKRKMLFDGLAQADSFTMDPHKLMNIPLICSVLLVKEKGRLRCNLTTMDTEYLYHEKDALSPALGKSSIQCGRRVDALKLWLAWRFFGDRGYGERMDRLIELTEYFQDRVMTSAALELLAEPQSVAVCFRYRNRNGQNIDDFNLHLRETIRKTGESIINYGYWQGNLVLRFVAVNPDARKEDIDQFFENLLISAGQLEGDREE